MKFTKKQIEIYKDIQKVTLGRFNLCATYDNSLGWIKTITQDPCCEISIHYIIKIYEKHKNLIEIDNRNNNYRFYFK